MVTCLICTRELHVPPDKTDMEVLQEHIESDINHRVFMAILQDFYMPPPLFDPIDDASYEELTELCDMMGNVSIGVTDVDNVSKVVIVDKKDAHICPICLEDITLCGAMRRLDACAHAFCSGCIETWFASHKTCPVCKVDVTLANGD